MGSETKGLTSDGPASSPGDDRLASWKEIAAYQDAKRSSPGELAGPSLVKPFVSEPIWAFRGRHIEEGHSIRNYVPLRIHISGSGQMEPTGAWPQLSLASPRGGPKVQRLRSASVLAERRPLVEPRIWKP